MNSITSLSRRKNWSGDISALSDEADGILSELGFGEPGSALNVRLIRHYQTKGCIGRPPDRDGARSLYGYRHLIEAVAVRVLLTDGWKLQKVGEALAHLEDGQIEELISARGASIAASKSVSETEGADPKVDVPLDMPGRARNLIAGFKQFEGSVEPVQSVRQTSAYLHTGSQSAGREIVEYAPAGWLRISVDRASLARAEPGARARAIAEAEAILAALAK